MRDIMPPTAAHLLKVDSYGDQGFSINGAMYTESVLLFPERVMLWNKPDITAWMLDDFAEVIHMRGTINYCTPSAFERPEILLLGTGKAHQFIHPDLKKAFKTEGISVDSMDTGAACRTYNILLSEGRHVAALLMTL